jgi:hypothetical protein
MHLPQKIHSFSTATYLTHNKPLTGLRYTNHCISIGMTLTVSDRRACIDYLNR